MSKYASASPGSRFTASWYSASAPWRSPVAYFWSPLSTFRYAQWGYCRLASAKTCSKRTRSYRITSRSTAASPQLGWRKRAAQAELRRSAIITRHAAQIENALFPNKSLQEREIAALHFYAGNGPELINRLVELAQARCPEHKVLRLSSSTWNFRAFSLT